MKVGHFYTLIPGRTISGADINDDLFVTLCLPFSVVEISDLGVVQIEAFNGENKPVSISADQFDDYRQVDPFTHPFIAVRDANDIRSAIYIPADQRSLFTRDANGVLVDSMVNRDLPASVVDLAPLADAQCLPIDIKSYIAIAYRLDHIIVDSSQFLK